MRTRQNQKNIVKNNWQTVFKQHLRDFAQTLSFFKKNYRNFQQKYRHFIPHTEEILKLLIVTVTVLKQIMPKQYTHFV